MQNFLNHISQESHRFSCTMANEGANGDRYEFVVTSIGNKVTNADKLERVLADKGEEIASLIAFYREVDGVDLYKQSEMPPIKIYKFGECRTNDKGLKRWFSGFESEAANRIKVKGVAIGEVGDSANLLMYKNGKITLARYWDDPVRLGSLEEMLDAVASDPVGFIELTGSVVRFYDENDRQYVPREYIKDAF